MSDAAGVGVLTTDRNLRVRSWNPWLSKATGRDEAQVLGRPLEELTGGPTSTWYHDIFNEVVESGSSRVLAPAFHRYLIPCPPQEPSAHFARMQQRVTVAPLRHESGIVGLIVTIEDVTWRLDAERELAEELQRGQDVAAAVASVGAPDWKMRRAAVDVLRHAASRQDVEHLIQTLQRDHHDINVLSSALQVLVSADIELTPALLAMLADADSNLRMHAALALGQLRSHAAVPALIDALDDADDNVRFHAIEALGSLGASEAVDALAALAESGNFFLAFAAVDALGKCDDAGVGSRLCAMLPDDTLRRAVVDTLATLGDEDCVPPLVGLLNSGVAEVPAIAAALERIHERYEGAYELGAHIADLVRGSIAPGGIAALSAAVTNRSGPLRPLILVLGWSGAAALPTLIEILGEPTVRASLDAAFMAIGRHSVEPLLRQVEEGPREARLAAAALLGRLGDGRAVGPLMALLDSADSELAAAAAGALGALGDPRAFTGLLALFAHQRAFVRQAAVSAVNAIGGDSIATRIRERLDDSDPRVRECAVRVAGYFGFDGCVDAILDRLHDDHDDVRRAAIEQLPVIKHAQALPLLIAAMASGTPRNRAAAAHAAGFFDAPPIDAALQQALDDADPWVRYFAAGSIARRQAGSAAAALVQCALHDPATHVRIAAMHALGVLDAPQLTGVAATLIRDAGADADLTAAALAALASVSNPHVDELLEATVRSSRLACRIPAVLALASRAQVRSVDVLAWAARVGDPAELRGVAVEGLRRLAQASATDVASAAVRELLALSVERDTRDDALSALAMLPDTAVETTAAALDSPRMHLRLSAVEALARMRHASASAALARGLEDPAAAVRSAVIGAFGRLGTLAVGPRIAAMQDSDPDDGVRRRAAAVCGRYGWRTR